MARQRREREELHRLRRQVKQLLADMEVSPPRTQPETAAPAPRPNAPKLPDGFSPDQPDAPPVPSRPASSPRPRRTS